MYYVIGKPRKSSLSQAQYHGSYDGISLSATIKNQRKKCEKKREVLVHKLEDEIHYEPYMISLQNEYCEPSTVCDSKIELPWKEIALPRTGMKIRQEVAVPLKADGEIFPIRSHDKLLTIDSEPRNFERTMELPWDDLVITDVVDARCAQATTLSSICDSSVEIPWGDLAFERPGEITPFHEPEKCSKDDIEIPWDEIMIPSNIAIEPKITKHTTRSPNVKRRRNNGSSPFNCHQNCQCDTHMKTQKKNGI